MCGNVLIAATISSLDSFSVEDGSLLSRWNYSELPSIDPLNETASKIQQCPAPEIGPVSGPPSKRQRQSSPGDEEECNDRKAKSRPSNGAKSAKGTPAITTLASTSDARHLIVVTGEDKTIRVFEHDGKGKLQQVSQRAMPKRPCALAVTADDSTLICADKFGDVYSLPLLYTIPSRSSELHDGPSNADPAPEAPSKPFIPAANNLTVHSVRNLRALQSQMKQTQKAPEKQTLDFERKLLLGHISMLTDIAVVEREGRSYIVTADRDEHIRISRGIPQAHVIERYCLGHKEFVSRLCFPGSRPNLLISGGGDNYLYVWYWYLGKMIQSINLQQHVESFSAEAAQVAGENEEVEGDEDGLPEKGEIAVSNIVYLGSTSNTTDDTVVVACEGVPALFAFALLRDSTLCYRRTLRLEGNPLDIIASNTTSNFIVSLDYVHEPGSKTRPRTPVKEGTQLVQLQQFHMTDSGIANTLLQFKTAYETETVINRDETDTHNLSNLLYSTANLRKRGAED